jgi:uncharacterized membrane protein
VLLLAATTTMASLCRQLPAQNVILATTVIVFAAGAALALNAMTAIPFGPVEYHPDLSGNLMGNVPWSVPVIWAVIVINARGVARLILRSRRHHPNYGLWVIGLAVLLVITFQLSFEPYAALVKAYWSWKPTKLSSAWYTVPWTDFLSGGVISLLILLFVTPALINKSPVHKPLSYYPLLVWELLSFLILTGLIVNKLWLVAGITFGHMASVAGLAMCGARFNDGG